MGKGSGGCVSRAALSLADDASETPGRSGRAKETYRLVQEAGNFPPAYLLRDIRKPSETILPSEVDAQDVAHNALMHWVPSSYHGHAGYIAEHEQLRQEVMYALMLDGDRRSNHLYFYRDRGMNAIWTLGSAAAARGWYRLPHDGDGNIVPQGLGQTVQASMHHPNGSFLHALRANPIETLAASIDVHEHGVSLEQLAPRLADTGADCQRAVWRFLSSVDEIPDAPLRHLRIRAALDIADAEGCSHDERDLLLHAAALAPGWDEPVETAVRAAPTPEIAALLTEMTPVRSEDDYPMVAPSTRLGGMLADAEQAWMASRWCDWGIYRWQRGGGWADSVETIDELRMVIPRTRWSSKYARDEYARVAKSQEARLRALAGLARGGTKLPPAPKGQKRLRPA